MDRHRRDRDGHGRDDRHHFIRCLTLQDAIADLRNETPLRRLGRELVVIRELIEKGVSYREGEITTVHVPWAQVQELRSMYLPAFEDKLFSSSS